MNETVFVLGAGASNDFDFPLNSALKEEILRRLKTESITDNNQDITQLKNAGFSRKEIYDFCNYFEGDYGGTIDEFLSENSHYWSLGKHIIAQALIYHENTIRIRRRPLDKNWYKLFLSKIDNGLTRFNEKDISFVTFNYDRSLEFALIDGIYSRYLRRPSNEIIEAFQKIKIIHVHGMLGNLEYSFGGEKRIVTNCRGGSREFNNGINPIQITTAAEGINIVHEDIDDSKEFNEARNILKNARNVAFVGFGFDRKNFDRLAREGTLKNKSYIRSNRFSTDTNVKIITDSTRGLLRDGHFVSGNALTFIKNMIEEEILFL